MLAGLPPAKLTTLGLTSKPEDFFYLKQSDCFKVSTIDDTTDFKQVVRAMGVLGIDEKDQGALWNVLAAILLLGNVRFTEQEDPTSRQPVVQLENPKVTASVSEVLHVDQFVLNRALTTRTITSGTQRRMSTITVPLDTAQAIYSRDALAKALYERVFHWLVAKINVNLRATDKPADLYVIGLLDIYGFEIFERNSFEQLNINYCNEKLQQLFIELTLKSEQEEYVREGIEWEPVKYFDNKPICDLVEKKPIGLISLLDEACMVGKSTDFTFLENLNIQFGKHPHFQSYLTSQDRSIPDTSFRLKHYAGDVTYDVQNFLDKNKDTLFSDLIAAMQGSSEKLLLELFPPVTANDAKKRPETAGSQFRTAMNTLITTLLSCNPHYVRCIKPNDTKKPGTTDEQRIRHQVRYLGLLENVRVRRAGFANRQTYERFYARYKMLCKETWPNSAKKIAKDAVAMILKLHKIAETEYRFGKTKVFIRNPTTLFYFEEKREAQLPRMAILIQKLWRGFRARSSYKKNKAAMKIQLLYKSYKSKKWAFGVIRAFQGVAKMPDYGKSVRWPPHPPVLDRGAGLVHKIHNTWRAEQMVKSLGPEESTMRQKALALEIFRGNKPWNCSRRFESNYLEKPTNPLHQKCNEAFRKIFTSYGDTNVLYADYIFKLNDKGRTEKRGVLITNLHMFKLHPKTFKVRRKAIPLVTIVSVSVSPFKDGVVIFHIKPPERDLVLDLSLCGYEGVSEIVTVVVERVLKLTGNRLPVAFSQNINFNNTRPSKKDLTITFQPEQPVPGASVIKKGKVGYIAAYLA
jgi:myosin-1